YVSTLVRAVETQGVSSLGKPAVISIRGVPSPILFCLVPASGRGLLDHRRLFHFNCISVGIANSDRADARMGIDSNLSIHGPACFASSLNQRIDVLYFEAQLVAV